MSICNQPTDHSIVSEGIQEKCVLHTRYLRCYIKRGRIIRKVSNNFLLGFFSNKQTVVSSLSIPFIIQSNDWSNRYKKRNEDGNKLFTKLWASGQNTPTMIYNHRKIHLRWTEETGVSCRAPLAPFAIYNKELCGRQKKEKNNGKERKRIASKR